MLRLRARFLCGLSQEDLTSLVPLVKGFCVLLHPRLGGWITRGVLDSSLVL